MMSSCVYRKPGMSRVDFLIDGLLINLLYVVLQGHMLHLTLTVSVALVKTVQHTGSSMILR